jgi:enoyl-CoA hydratase/carnithine racemase
MSDGGIRVERTDGVVVVTMDDAATRNALSPEMAEALYEEMDRFEAAAYDRVMVLTGADPSFCSGASVRRFDSDIESRQVEEAEPHRPWGKMEARLATRAVESGQAGFGSVSDVPLRISEIQKPTIAAVNGHAIGVGLGLALACDIRVASERAEFAEAFVRMGLVPGDGSTWQLPRMIGLSNTYFMQYTGDRIAASEAHRINLVSKIYAHDELMGSTLELASRMAHGATYAMSLTKYLVQRSHDMDLKEALRLAQAAQELARRSDDHKEAVKAFLAKRKPEFKGR